MASDCGLQISVPIGRHHRPLPPVTAERLARIRLRQRLRRAQAARPPVFPWPAARILASRAGTGRISGPPYYFVHFVVHYTGIHAGRCRTGIEVVHDKVHDVVRSGPGLVPLSLCRQDAFPHTGGDRVTEDRPAPEPRLSGGVGARCRAGSGRKGRKRISKAADEQTDRPQGPDLNGALMSGLWDAAPWPTILYQLILSMLST